MPGYSLPAGACDVTWHLPPIYWDLRFCGYASAKWRLNWALSQAAESVNNWMNVFTVISSSALGHQSYYKLRIEEPNCIHSGAREGAFRLQLRQTWTDLDEARNISEGSRCALTQKIGGNRPRIAPKDAKTCFVFVTNTTRTFGHLGLRPILHQFWPLLTLIKDVNRCPPAYTGTKFPKFCAGNFTGPKTAKIGTFEGCLW